MCKGYHTKGGSTVHSHAECITTYIVTSTEDMLCVYNKVLTKVTEGRASHSMK